MTFRYLTFDCYGTLIDWRKGIEASLRDSFGELPVRGEALMKAYVEAEKAEESEYQKYRDVLRKTSIRLTTQLGVGNDEPSASRFAASVPSWPAFADTVATLKELGRRGYKRYILSNVDADLLGGTISENGLEVDGFVSADEVRSYKPAFGHWLRLMERSGAKKHEILHVAQSLYHDILPAQELGISSAWVNRYREPLPPAALPLYIADSLSHLALILDREVEK